MVKGDTIDEIKYKSSTGSYIDLGTLKNRCESDTDEGVCFLILIFRNACSLFWIKNQIPKQLIFLLFLT